MQKRNYTTADLLLMGVDQALRTLVGRPQVTERPNPADAVIETSMTEKQQRHTARLMRINHTGEVCAQALYQGQALTARLPEVREKMEQAAAEENDHLEWCADRLQQLDSRVSLFNPLWYAGSFTIGAIAGAIGDKWSLGFVAETEHQVVRHLQSHLQKLPDNDHQSRAILEQMKQDEMHHATVAIAAGGAELPGPVKSMMHLMGKVMTSTVYYV